MVALGNFLYRTRLYVFPAACLLVFLPGPRIWQEDLVAALLGFAIALSGQLIRAEEDLLGQLLKAAGGSVPSDSVSGLLRGAKPNAKAVRDALAKWQTAVKAL